MKRGFPQSEPAYRSKRRRDFTPFLALLSEFGEDRADELDALLAGRTILDFQRLMVEGRLTAEVLTLYYLDRIDRYDIDKLNAVLALNPDALAIAKGLDDERAAGQVRGPMHGIPVLLKDNIATGDRMHTTVGAYAMRHWRANRDAYLVQRLRAAGAVVLGKANLSEWANWMDFTMPNGFSTLGGQTRNPYGPFDTSGSSSGSAVAVAAELVTASVGTETRGSIISPGEANSIVALKTSLGLVSRDHIVPLVDWLDVPGPMGRSVTDVAIMLTAMTGVDDNDPATERAAALAGVDFTRYLHREAAASLRVGVFDGCNPAYIAQLEAEGMTVTHLDQAALPDEPDIIDVLNHGFKETFNHWLADLGDAAPVSSLADVIAANAEDMANRARYGHGKLLDSQNNQINADEYASMVALGRAATATMENIFKSKGIDVILTAPDTPSIYATTGFPALTIPAGYDGEGKPIAMTLMANFLGEPALLTAGFAFEQATQARRAPNLHAVLASYEGLHHAVTMDH